MNPAARLFPCSLGVALLGLPASASARAQAIPAAQLRPLAYTRFALPNGLVAILNEDHTTPIVSVQVWYHVGSKDDDPARPGIVHLCEHMTSQGSAHLNQAQRPFYQSLGGVSTRFAQTTEDVTKYFITVPSNELETVLWAESDRMASPLVLADSQRIAAVARAVAQERRQDIDNVPFGTYRELTPGTLFPPGNPYHLAPSSANDSLAAVTPAALRAKCLPYYVPNNAVLAISGDFSTSSTRALVEKYFAGIPSGSAVTRSEPRVEPLGSERRLVLEDARATQPRLHIAWRGAAYDSPDRMAALAAASALSLPRFGRLSKLLVNDRRVASSVTADNHDLEKSGVFEIVVTPNPGASMTEIEHLVDSTIAALEATPVSTEEIARFNAFNGVSGATSLQLHIDRADTLAHDQVFAGDPSSYVAQGKAALALTPADVQAAVRRYLTPARVVMSLVPAGRLELISKPNAPYTNVTPRSASPGARP